MDSWLKAINLINLIFDNMSYHSRLLHTSITSLQPTNSRRTLRTKPPRIPIPTLHSKFPPRSRGWATENKWPSFLTSVSSPSLFEDIEIPPSAPADEIDHTYSKQDTGDDEEDKE